MLKTITTCTAFTAASSSLEDFLSLTRAPPASMSSNTIQSNFLFFKFLMVIVILASATVFTTATSYDKYDPGYGIYDDGFSRNDYGHYRMESKYAVKYGSYRGLRPALSRYSSGRIGTAVHAGYEPPSPHHSAFY